MAQVTNSRTYRKSVNVPKDGLRAASIPVPNVLASGTSSTPLTITDTSKNFIALGVAVGFLVVNTSTGTSGTVSSFTATQITITPGIGIATNDKYIVYAGGSIDGTVWEGPVLMNQDIANRFLTIRTMDGYDLTVNIPAGSICPIQVSNVVSNPQNYGIIVALWS